MNFSNRACALFSFGLTVLVVSATLIIIGCYFEEYEVVANQIILDQFTTSFGKGEIFNNVHFLLLPVYGKLTSIFPKIPIYSTIYIIHFSLAYFFIVLGILILIRKKEYKEYGIKTALIILFTTVLLIDNLIFINNVRICLLLIFASLIWLHLLYLTRHKGTYFILPMLFLLGLLMRMEIALLSTFTALVFSIFFLKRRYSIAVLAMFLCCMFAFQTYKIVNARLDPTVGIVHKAEHELHDRQNINYDLLSEKEMQKRMAMTFFIADGDAFSIDDYPALYEKKSLSGYVFNRDIVFKFIGKSTQLIKYLKGYYWLFIIACTLLIYLSRNWEPLFDSKFSLYKFYLFCLFFMALPFVLNLFLSVPSRFIVPYLSIAIITLIIYIVTKKGEQVRIEGLVMLCLVALIFTSLNGFSKVKSEKSQQKVANQFTNSLLELGEQGKVGVMYNINMDVYPSKLFSTSKSDNVKHYYLDFYFYYVYDYYIQHHKPFFGDGYKSLLSRMKRCSEDDVIFYSNDEYNIFLSDYLSTMYGSKVKFHSVDNFVSDGLRTYKVILP